MITHYTVVQYLPKPLSGERINVGVIAWAEGRIAAKFIGDWRRVRSFGGEDIDFVRDFVRRIEDAAENTPSLPGFERDSTIDEARLRKFIGDWVNSIQFSDPKTSLKPPDEVVSEVSPIFLRTPRQHPRRARDRRFVAALAYHRISAAVKQVLDRSTAELVKRHFPIRGRFDEHQFDVVVANGRPLFAAQGLSFELPDSVTLRKDVDATAWAVDDVRKRKLDLPLAVLALPPKKETKLYARATQIFEGLDAAVLTESDVDKWATRVAKKTLAAD